MFLEKREIGYGYAQRKWVCLVIFIQILLGLPLMQKKYSSPKKLVRIAINQPEFNENL